MRNTKKPLERFIEKVQSNTGHGFLLVPTILSHQIESQYQDPSSPRIFLRECDPDGISRTLWVNPCYNESIGTEIQERLLTLNEGQEQKTLEVLDRLADSDEFWPKIDLLLEMDLLESRLFEGFRAIYSSTPEIVGASPQLIQRFYDDEGIPFAYKMNPNAVDISRSGEHYSIGLKGRTKRVQIATEIETLLRQLDERVRRN